MHSDLLHFVMTGGQVEKEFIQLVHYLTLKASYLSQFAYNIAFVNLKFGCAI